ncbi:hypothetical protein [Sphingomonas fuzhouensis]|uniref:hypothetical protein n=1 Tax=Sphingomonas fuzhouensis TaxID=3106033 RepID=UPI002AFEB782|nr:hypothetical protein [Sphingomonas sp. SGZ-02]
MTDAQANQIRGAISDLNAVHTLCEAIAAGNYSADEHADFARCVGVVVSTVAERLDTALRAR